MIDRLRSFLTVALNYRLDDARRRFLKWSLIGSAVAYVVVAGAVGELTKHYRVGLDLQDQRCLPWTVYIIKYGRPDTFARGDLVAFVPRGGLMGPKFEGRVVAKMVAGIPGDRLVVKDDFASIAGRSIGKLILLDRLGVKPGSFDREEVVPEGKVLLVGTEPRSYDGRYWGALSQTEVVGTVIPLF